MQNPNPAPPCGSSLVISLFNRHGIFFLFLTTTVWFGALHNVWAANQPLDLTQPPQIGRILIDRANVFDLSNQEINHIPYTWANSFHVITRERFIRRELLFAEGDPFDAARIQESERALRARPIFRFVSITAQPPVDGKVDVLVRTEDVWTTSVQLGLGTAGGKTFYRLGLLEHNFLGTGNTVGAFVRQDIDRFIKGVTVDDPHLLGSLWNGFFGYGQDEKGRDWEARLRKPYLTFLTPQSYGLDYRLTENEDRLFEDGEEVANFNHDRTIARADTSVAIDPNPRQANRVGVAYEARADHFSDLNAEIPLAPLVDRTVHALLANYWYKQNYYSKLRGVNTFDRDEDINRGWDIKLEAGPSLRAWGSSQDGLVNRLAVQRNWIFQESQVIYAGLDLDGRLEQGVLTDTMLRFKGQYTALNWFSNNVLSLRGESTFGINLPSDKQYLLGGENGLRGYAVRQFSGNKKVIFTLENRQAVIYDWMSLANVGWAVFVDSGGVWKEHQSIALGEFRSDVGVGLRFSPSRSVDPGIIHADVAYALDENNQHSRLVLNIGGSFEFGDVEVRKYDQ